MNASLSIDHARRASKAFVDADKTVALALGKHRHRPAIRHLGAMSDIADQGPTFAACGTLLVAGLILQKPKLAEAGGRMLTAVALATAMKSTLKWLIPRDRPNVVLDGAGQSRAPRSGGDGGHDSFPSGHTADAVAAARAIVRTYPGTGAPAYAAAVAIAAIQVPRAKHFPADLAAGAVIGVAAEALTDLAANAFIRRARRELDDQQALSDRAGADINAEQIGA